MAQNKPKRKLPRGIYSDNGTYCIQFFVDGKRHRQRIGPNLRQAEAVLGKKRAEVREGRFFDAPKRTTATFDDLANEYMRWIAPNEQAGIPARKRSWKTFDLYAVNQLRRYFRQAAGRYYAFRGEPVSRLATFHDLAQENARLCGDVQP